MEKITERLEWIRDLVKSEERMEETGVVDMSIGFDNDQILNIETLRLLQQLKNELIDTSNAFNELKTSPLGRIKIYGIAKTQADFMLFRNGYKMIFSLRDPGVISVRFNFLGPSQYLPTQIPSANQSVAQLMEEHLIIAKRGPFKELMWTFQDQKIDFVAMVRYHLTLFIRESAK
jgi:hypothetical protein